MLDTVKPLPGVVDQVLERGVEGEGAALLVQPDEEIWKQSICRKPQSQVVEDKEGGRQYTIKLSGWERECCTGA